MKKRTALIGLIGLIGLFIIVLQINAATGPEQREKHASELQCPTAREAQTGEMETLRFLIKPGMDVDKNLNVECSYRDAETYFFVFREGEEDVNIQDERFKGKADLSLEESSSGNVLLKMTVDYPGTYNCRVYDEVQNNCSTTLTVRAREPDPVTESNPGLGEGNSDPANQDSDPGTIWGTIWGTIGGIAIAGIAIAGIIFYIKKIR